VGGAPGYAEFLAAITDPTHEEHEHMLTWCGGAFDPQTPDVDRIAGELDRLARKWTPRPRKPKAAILLPVSEGLERREGGVAV